MTDKNVWLITGAARGMGVDIAKAALTAGHAVVATAPNADSDPAKLAAALLTVTQRENPPRRWVAGADAVATVEQQAQTLLVEVDAHLELSSNLAHDDA